MIIVVMGVAGTGKTTLGLALAARMGWPFVDADDYHPPANIAKMRGGQALEERDRAPWLDAVNARIKSIASDDRHAILACSALKRSHRERLEEGITGMQFVYLDGDPALIDRRLRERKAHFMPARLLDTQLAALEPPVDALRVPIAQPTRRQVDTVIQALDLPDA